MTFRVFVNDHAVAGMSFKRQCNAEKQADRIIVDQPGVEVRGYGSGRVEKTERGWVTVDPQPTGFVSRRLSVGHWSPEWRSLAA